MDCPGLEIVQLCRCLALVGVDDCGCLNDAGATFTGLIAHYQRRDNLGQNRFRKKLFNEEDFSNPALQLYCFSSEIRTCWCYHQVICVGYSIIRQGPNITLILRLGPSLVGYRALRLNRERRKGYSASTIPLVARPAGICWIKPLKLRRRHASST